MLIFWRLSAQARSSNYRAVLTNDQYGPLHAQHASCGHCVVLARCMTSMMGGYAFARIKFPGRDLIFRLYLGTMMIPFMVIFIPSYKLMLAFRLGGQVPVADHPLDVYCYGHVPLPAIFTRACPWSWRRRRLSMGPAALVSCGRSSRRCPCQSSPPRPPSSFLYAWNSFIWPLVIINSKTTMS